MGEEYHLLREVNILYVGAKSLVNIILPVVLLTPNGFSVHVLTNSVGKITLGPDCNSICLLEVFRNVKIMSRSGGKLVSRNSQYLYSCDMFGYYIS